MKKKTAESIEWIKENYPKFKAYSDLYARALYETVLEDCISEELLQEFVKTVPSGKTLSTFQKQFKHGVSIRKVVLPTGGEDLEVEVKSFSESLQKELESFFDSFGWYPAAIFNSESFDKYSEKSVEKYRGKKNIKITFESKYDQEVVPKTKVLHHATPDYNLRKIQLIGLTPKSKGKLSAHPGRIYLIEKFSEEYDSQDLAATLFSTDPRQELIKDMLILEVDISGLKNHVFYRDPNFFTAPAVWTYDNIPPSVIKVVERLGMAQGKL